MRPRPRQTREAEDELRALLRELVARDGRTRHTISRASGMDPSYVTRVLIGVRRPDTPRFIEAISRALHLGAVDQAKLSFAAGLAPPGWTWTEALQRAHDNASESPDAQKEPGRQNGAHSTILGALRGRLLDSRNRTRPDWWVGDARSMDAVGLGYYRRCVTCGRVFADPREYTADADGPRCKSGCVGQVRGGEESL